MKEFLEFIAKHLVDNPDAVKIDETENNGKILLKLFVDDKAKPPARVGQKATGSRTSVKVIPLQDSRAATPGLLVQVVSPRAKIEEGIK